MKKNLTLFSILLSLILLAYYSEELGEQQKQKKLQLKERMYDPDKFGELQGLETPVAKLLKGRDDYYTSKEYKLADRSIVDSVFGILGGIKARRFLAPAEIAGKNRASFIPDEKLKFTFLFKKGTLTYVLGKKLDFDRSFYVEIDNSLTGVKTMAIAYDTTADKEPKSRSEYYKSSEKYNRLMALLSLPEEYFYNRQLFRKLTPSSPVSNWKDVTIKNIRNRSFTLHVDTLKTSPSIVSGLKYNQKSFDTFLRKLVEVKANKLLLKWDKKGLSGFLGSISIIKNNGEKILLKLFNSYQGREGHYATSTESDDLYYLDPDDARIFFGNHQAFWVKVPLPLELRDAPKLSFKLTVGKENFSMIGYFRGESRFQILDARKLDPKQKVFRTLFTYLFADGDTASILNHEEDENQLIHDSFLSLELDNNLFYFTAFESDLYIINSSKSFKVRFIGAADKLPTNVAGLFYAKE